MASNLDRFKADLDKLAKEGDRLLMMMDYECRPDRINAAWIKEHGQEEGERMIARVKALPSFRAGYQSWYSEALAVVRQLLPDRTADFVRHYEKPKTRKSLTNENYRIEDYLQGLTVSSPLGEVIVKVSAAMPHFEQQVAILKSASARFESSLFDIKHIVQADLLDSEIETAEELAKYKFVRAAGAVAGVVLERHLGLVCADRKCSPPKKNPTISDFNDALRNAGAIDVPQWRFIQHLADTRNLCDHSKVPEPTKEQVDDLIAGVKKIAKTVF
ncbi:hypothetical protein WIX39_022580 [Variovorax sp. AB1(2024)]|uniref:hypothetical protein n=1 Tax=Variovorax sp. AB1(2024) TaxID=3132214 RepID=UPI0030A3C6E0